MKTLITLLLTLWLCLLTIFVQAQSVKVRSNTNANIYSLSNRHSELLETGEPDDCFGLLDDGEQQNGYYHVKCNTSDNTGWIFRSLVRRFEECCPDEVVADGSRSFSYSTIDIFGVGQIPVGYYSGCSNLAGDELKTKLHKKIRGHTKFTYDQVWEALTFTDEDPANSDNVVLLYTLRSQQKTQRDHGWDWPYEERGYTYSNSWNREHVWAKSHGFPHHTDTAYTDLHHLRPADRSVNTGRNHKAFCECDEPYYDTGDVLTKCFNCSEEYGWEPPDVVKGDIARMIFYMAVRYEGFMVDGEKVKDLEVIDIVTNYQENGPVHGKLSTLLQWHKQDPVDNWERRRNHIIYYKYQNNRNPFIDHPEFVGKIWGGN